MVAFVILHYQDMDITQKCVVSIEKIMKELEYHIIIVDNASPNEIGKKLQQYYEDNNHCTVICNKENLGFAQGNNIGYSYAKENYSPKYIVVMNNDVIIDDEYFFAKIEKTYVDTKFHVLGPDIINVGTGQRQNPMRKHTKDEIMEIFSRYRRRYRFPRLFFTIEVAQGKFKRSIAKLSKNKERSESPNNVSKQERVYNPVLHGACYVLSELFINSEDIVFDPRTFLYWEEYLLWIRLNEKKYTLIFEPSVSVEHFTGYATVKAQENAYKRTKNFYKYYYESLKILIEVIESVGWEKIDG